MSALPPDPSIRDLQNYIAEIERVRKFIDQSPIEKCLLLGEEVGELFKAVRKSSGIGVDPNSFKHTVEEELADVLSFVLAIANRYSIDLTAAFVEKEKKNCERIWI